MFKYNKLRYWLGLPCVVTKDGKFYVRITFLFTSHYMSKTGVWWSWKEYTQNEFIGRTLSEHDTAESAYEAYKKASKFVIKPKPI